MASNSPNLRLGFAFRFRSQLISLFGQRTRIYKSFLDSIGFRAKTATSPRIPSGGHYSKLFIQPGHWAEWENDLSFAEGEQLQSSAARGWQISFSLSLSFYFHFSIWFLFVILLKMYFTSSLCDSACLFPADLYSRFFKPLMCTNVCTDTHTVYSQFHPREPNSESAFPRILVQGILIGHISHYSCVKKKKIQHAVC